MDTRTSLRRIIDDAAAVIDAKFGEDYSKNNPGLVSEVARLGFEIERNGIPFVAHEPAPPVVHRKRPVHSCEECNPSHDLLPAYFCPRGSCDCTCHA